MDRVRFALGDVAATALLPDATYTYLLDTYDEAGAVRAAAQALAVLYAQKPGSVRLPSGLSVSWGERVRAWQAIATGAAGGLAGGFSASPVRADGYAASATEYTRGCDDLL